jgi:hypothetical protein
MRASSSACSLTLATFVNVVIKRSPTSTGTSPATALPTLPRGLRLDHSNKESEEDEMKKAIVLAALILASAAEGETYWLYVPNPDFNVRNDDSTMYIVAAKFYDADPVSGVPLDARGNCLRVTASMTMVRMLLEKPEMTIPGASCANVTYPEVTPGN